MGWGWTGVGGGVVGGCEGGEETMCLAFPISIMKIIFLILKELLFLKQIFSNCFDQPNTGKCFPPY